MYAGFPRSRSRRRAAEAFAFGFSLSASSRHKSASSMRARRAPFDKPKTNVSCKVCLLGRIEPTAHFNRALEIVWAAKIAPGRDTKRVTEVASFDNVSNCVQLSA
jgi:hypothetical protein